MASRALLLSTYDLGRQPIGLAAKAMELRRAGLEPSIVDLSVEGLDRSLLHDVDLVGWYVPMHTAARLALALMAEVRAAFPRARLFAWGLYATLHADLLASMGVEVSADIVELPLDRAGLLPMERYGRFVALDGSERLVGVTAASVGCRYRCRHCPVVALPGGGFRATAVSSVLADIELLVRAGATHITFADPDFLNGPVHARRVVDGVAARWPGLSFDFTARVAHLRRHSSWLADAAGAGCVMVTSAVESFDQAVLEHLDKGHSVEDVAAVVDACRAAGIALNPTFVPFTPWTSRATLAQLLDSVAELGLVGSVAPVQYGLRLLVTAHSALLEVPDVAALVEPFDPSLLCYPWRHPDSGIDELQRQWSAITVGDVPRAWAHAALRAALDGGTPLPAPAAEVPSLPTVPYLTEPWFC